MTAKVRVCAEVRGFALYARRADALIEGRLEESKRQRRTGSVYEKEKYGI